MDAVKGDPVNNPNHYARFAVQPIDFITKNKLEFWAGNVIKYVMRFDAKDGLQDLKKARRYLDAKIDEMEAELDRARAFPSPTPLGTT